MEGSQLWTWLRWVKPGYVPNHPSPSAVFCGKYIDIFIRCIISDQHDIIMAAIADVSKGQTDMLHKGEHQS